MSVSMAVRPLALRQHSLLHQRYKGRDAAFVMTRAAEMSKDELLELLDAVLEVHEVHDRLVAAREQGRDQSAYTLVKLEHAKLTPHLGYRCS